MADTEELAELSDGAEPFIKMLIKEEELEALAIALERLPEREMLLLYAIIANIPRQRLRYL